MWKNDPFFRAALARLEEYHTGGCGRIRFYRVKHVENYETRSYHF